MICFSVFIAVVRAFMAVSRVILSWRITRRRPRSWPSTAPRAGTAPPPRRRWCRTHVTKFAELSGDYNPLYFDSEFVERTPFGRLVVQGGLTTGLLHDHRTR